MMLTTYCVSMAWMTTIHCNVNDKRLDVYIASALPGITRSAVQKLLENGKITLNNIPLQKNHKTSIGEIYTVIQNEPDVSALKEQNIPLDIIFEDDDLIVVNKPTGMVVHPAPGHPDNTLVNALLYHCGSSLSGIGGVIRPGIVHRIDKNTSGLVIAAKNDKAHVSLAGQLSKRTMVRKYQTIVCGNVKNPKGTIDAPIGRHPTDRKRQAIYDKNKNSELPQGIRSAVTHYEVLNNYNGYTHLICSLETGRTHQIRVHLAHIGYPVLGDTVYGRKKPELKMESQCLHAWELQFVHPTSNKNIKLYADLPDYFVSVLELLNKRN